MKTLIIIVAACLVLAWASSAHAQIAVVVAAESDVATMTSAQVAALFLGKTDVFPVSGQCCAGYAKPNLPR